MHCNVILWSEDTGAQIMTQDIEQNLKNLGIELPTAPSPAANYVPFVIVGNFLYVSGQISQNENGLIIR